MANIRIPAPLRKLTNDIEIVKTEESSLSAAIDALDRDYPGIKDRICDEAGNVRRFVNIYVGGEDIRFLEDKATPVKEADEVSIVPAIAGG